MIRPFLFRLLKLQVWLLERLRLGEFQATLFWAGLVGLLGGFASVLFRSCIHGLQWLFTQRAGSLVQIASQLPIEQRLLIPAAGGLLAGGLLHFGMRLLPGQSSTDYMEAVALGDGVIRSRSTLVKSASSLLSIASGGSIGKEGPMVQLSAMLASFVGRMARFSTPRLQLIVACGAAAGIASAYNAPIAGALFVAEIVLGSISMESFGPLVFSSVLATVTVRQMVGPKPIYEIPTFELISNWELLPYLLLGLLAGVAAPLFLRFLEKSGRLFSKVKAPLPIRMALGGLVVGLLSIRCPEVWGNGYSVVSSILNSSWLWQALLLVFLFKLLATVATVGSGAVGGVFTPTLFFGAVLGALFGIPLHACFPNWTATSSAYALVGMGCFLAATTHAPLTSILMLFEMTLDYAIVLPLMLACVTAYYVSQGIQRKSIYSDVLRRKMAETKSSFPFLEETKVGDLMKADPPCVFETAFFTEIAQMFAKYRYNYLYVINRERQFCGAIGMHDIKSVLNNPDLEQARWVIALDLMRKPFPFLVAGAPLQQAMEVFSQHDGERVPVVNNATDRKLLGVISKTDLLLTLAHGTQKSKPVFSSP